MIFVTISVFSGCVTRGLNHGEVSREYPIVDVKTVHQNGLLGSSCDYTVVYYQTDNSIENDIVKPCLVGTTSLVHISMDGKQSVIVGIDRDFDKVIKVIVTEETFKNNIW